MKSVRILPAVLVVAATVAPSASAEGPTHRKLSSVPFTAVKIDDGFWSPRIRTNRVISLPHNFKWCEQTGRIANFAKAGGLRQGQFKGIYFDDSDVHKVLEGASYSLADHPDPALEKIVDDVIAKMASAQEDDGYLNTYYTLVEPEKKWTDIAMKCELYCGGHFIEAAAAHHRATGKRTYLDLAVKFADLIDSIFGPGKRYDVPGHQGLELALVKLYEATGEERYFNLAKFFVDRRGNKAHRERLFGEYCQDHRPVVEQSEIVGHAVRAMYFYSGVADVAGYTGDEGCIAAMDRLWQSVTRRKLYVTGGIGARRQNEGFSGDYQLPNAEAYCETCAAIGMVFWNHRLNLMHGRSRYADMLEQTLYNGVLSGVDLSGEKFFYVNPLASEGKHHRRPFYGCACCPTNVVRFIPSVPGYIYAAGKDSVYVNLYTAGTAKIRMSGGDTVTVKQETRYPWDGKVRLTVDMPKDREDSFQLHLRIPQWCERATMHVNGKVQSSLTRSYGYFPTLHRWKSGDVIELDMEMPVRRIEVHPAVEADRGRVAVARGPLVYCFEAVDNDTDVSELVLPRDPKFRVEHRDDLLGGVTVIQGIDDRGKRITAIPYYAWDHREPGKMAVWVRQDGKDEAPAVNDPAWTGQLYRTMRDDD